MEGNILTKLGSGFDRCSSVQVFCALPLKSRIENSSSPKP